MTRLAVLQGGGERVEICKICGVPHFDPVCRILARHLAFMQQLGRSPRTIYERQLAVRRVARWLAPVPLVDVTGPGLAAWRASLRLSPVGTAVVINHLKQFYAHVVSEGIRDDNPAAKLPSPRVRPYLPRPISAKRLALALETAPPRVRPWLLLAAYAGLRAAEIAGLRADRVLLSHVPPLLLVTGKGGKERAVPVSTYLLAELTALNLPASGWIFPRCDGGRGQNTAAMVSNLANKALHDAGIPDSFHSLRHYCATMAYQGSKDLLALSHLLGHANVSTTSVYARFSDPAVLAAVEAIPAPKPKLRAVRKDGTA